ncbi:AraC-like DNA-binding protein [Scopulibacillus darangshiensis]|uniref:AraC-like DNA-binding protein n=1 Tax=Scopulibacillus darangshiensis TaxID=442528 RepID=A0A4R2P725_9BACL|nr:AraC family transcriptional regulator [Scopulibacillus darangshiensis]TCP29605.1 AraC-like DNA-binding protein [Scopulibacillus darangshiensis]
MFDTVGTFQTDEIISEELFVYECGFEDVKPREPYQYEQIDYYLMHYILEGEGLFFIHDDVHHLQAGDGFVIPPYTDNNYYPIVGNPWSYRWVGFKGTQCERLLSSCGLGNGRYTFRYDKDVQIGNLISSIFTYCNKNKLYAALGELYHVFNILMTEHENSLRYKTSEAEQYVAKALDVIHSQYQHADLTIEDISALVKIERTYLFKLFKQYITLGPKQYLIQHRLNKACELLRKTSFSINEISRLVGFNTLSHFSKTFAAHNNMSPIKYREQFVRRK